MWICIVVIKQEWWMYTTLSLRSGYIHRKITSKSKYRENRLPIFYEKCDIVLISNDREKIYNDCKKILDIFIVKISK